MQQLQTINTEKTAPQQVLFMPKLYDETMHLLLQAKNYFNIYSHEDQHTLSPLQRLIYTSVMSRITLRLSITMSWILARRAYHAGQLTEEEIQEHYRLQFQDECMAHSSPFSHFLPSFVQKLCRESLALYSRIDALDSIQPHSA